MCLEEVEAVCSRAVIISQGRIVAQGTPSEFKSRSKTGRIDDYFREVTGAERQTSAQLGA
jgi:ABC-2 type transport system ATP-binding protein